MSGSGREYPRSPSFNLETNDFTPSTSPLFIFRERWPDDLKALLNLPEAHKKSTSAEKLSAPTWPLSKTQRQHFNSRDISDVRFNRHALTQYHLGA